LSCSSALRCSAQAPVILSTAAVTLVIISGPRGHRRRRHDAEPRRVGEIERGGRGGDRVDPHPGHVVAATAMLELASRDLQLSNGGSDLANGPNLGALL
jgi:hypothetical protein